MNHFGLMHRDVDWRNSSLDLDDKLLVAIPYQLQYEID